MIQPRYTHNDRVSRSVGGRHLDYTALRVRFIMVFCFFFFAVDIVLLIFDRFAAGSKRCQRRALHILAEQRRFPPYRTFRDDDSADLPTSAAVHTPPRRKHDTTRRIP